MKRLVVLISGQGSNLQALLDVHQTSDFGGTVVAVGADRPDAAGLEFARQRGIPTFVTQVSDYPQRQQWDEALTAQVGQYEPDLIISAGFLKLVGPIFLDKFAGKFINTHNSLLPAFAGMNGPRDALEYGVRITGATLFFVDQGVDSGVIIAQVAVPVLDEDTLETLTERIKVAERAQLVEWVRKLCHSRWTIQGRKLRLEPA